MNAPTDTVLPGCHVELIDRPIELERLRGRLDDPDCGAQFWFLGLTRRRTTDDAGRWRETVSLTYDAYRPMAERELQRLASGAAERFGLRQVVISHRLGSVPVGDASVAVGCSSPHRAASLQAVGWIMDELKRHVPIWKRETFADGSEEWVHPVPADNGKGP